KKSRQRLADCAQLDLEFIDQNTLNVEILAPRRTRCKLKFLRRDDSVCYQMIVLAFRRSDGLLALMKGDRKRLTEVSCAFFHCLRKRLAILGIDDLDDADQLLGLRIDYRCHQHLLGAIARLEVDLLEKIQLRAVGL